MFFRWGKQPHSFSLLLHTSWAYLIYSCIPLLLMPVNFVLPRFPRISWITPMESRGWPFKSKETKEWIVSLSNTCRSDLIPQSATAYQHAQDLIFHAEGPTALSHREATRSLLSANDPWEVKWDVAAYEEGHRGPVRFSPHLPESRYDGQLIRNWSVMPRFY